jgi:hypothetical protein
MIPDDHKNEIITNGLHFMRSITEAYGAEEGMRLWDTIASTLDPDLKGEIFFAMISGTHNDTIVLKRSNTSTITNRVAAIKEIRTWTGYGLKEAKDTSDLVEMGRAVSIKVNPKEHVAAVRGLRNVGFAV